VKDIDPSKFTDVEHVHDHEGRHWIRAVYEGRAVRGHAIRYESIAELGPLRAMTDYFGERVYAELPIRAEAKSCVTPYRESEPDAEWRPLWERETAQALESTPLWEQS
jgi:hypothetical protein